MDCDNNQTVEWIDDHKEKSSEDYNPYNYVYEVDLMESGCREILEDFDWGYED